MRFPRLLLLGLLCIALHSCQFYHDTTARFNAYFLAKEKMKEAELALFGNPENRFHEVLDILVEIDTNHTKSQKAAFDYVIEKASLPIQFHKRSKWVDDCYLLIGKARLYQGDFGNASTTFKYVNANSNDDNARHSTLIWLMRQFLESKEYNNLLYIKDIINAEEVPFTEENTRDYHLVMAQYTLLRNDYALSSQHLELAVPFVDLRAERARLFFALGQLFERTNQPQKALEAYQKAKKLSPTFELELYADAGAKAAVPVNSQTEEEERERYYRRQIADENNWDYRDKFYYDWAEMKVQRNNYPEAILLLNQSIQASTINTAQKSISYLRSGELYYDIEKFEEAATYYDSALQIMPKDLKRYDAVAERTAILQEFVEQLNIVREQDKLLQLAERSTEEIIAFFEKEIALEKEKIIQYQENKQLNEQQNQRVTLERTPLIGGGSSKQNTNWYFYNPDLTVIGRSNFLRKWGDRPLQDNWRLASKQPANKVAQNNQPNAQTDPNNIEGDNSIEDIFASVKPLEERLAAVPTTPEKIAEVKATLEDALYKLGNIYYYKLKEPKNTLTTFERLINEFPDSEFAPEAAYSLYLLCKEHDLCDEETYRDIIVEKFPDSFYAKVFQDPQYIAKLKAANAEVEKLYAKAYDYYKHGYYLQSEQLVKQIQQSFAEHSHQDKVALLAAMLKGRTVGLNPYYAALNQFVANYPESPLVEYAKELLGDKLTEPLNK